jgi:hypothetical protein
VRFQRFTRSAGAILPPLSSSAVSKALFALPSLSVREVPAANRPRINVAGQVPLTGGAVFHRVALDG